MALFGTLPDRDAPSTNDGGSANAAAAPPGSTTADEAAEPSDDESLAAVETVGGGIPDGRYVRLGSFRSAQSAGEESERLEAEGIPTTVVDSNRTAGLLPGFFVIVSGPTTGASEERRIVRDGARAGIAGALVGDLGPAAPVSPGALAGEYSGSVKQVDRDAEPPDRDRDLVVVFDTGGETGSVSYDSPACESTLTFDRSDGATLVYAEDVVSGPCQDGSWSAKLEASELLATWWETGGVAFRIGRLRP